MLVVSDWHFFFIMDTTCHSPNVLDGTGLELIFFTKLQEIAVLGIELFLLFLDSCLIQQIPVGILIVSCDSFVEFSFDEGSVEFVICKALLFLHLKCFTINISDKYVFQINYLIKL